MDDPKPVSFKISKSILILGGVVAIGGGAYWFTKKSSPAVAPAAKPSAINGAWSAWSDCVNQNGVCAKKRTCIIEAQNGGKPCSEIDGGDAERLCDPVNGNWYTPPDSATACALKRDASGNPILDATGREVWVKQKTCTNPAPCNGGSACPGDAEERCQPIDGKWASIEVAECKPVFDSSGVVLLAEGKQVYRKTVQCTPPQFGGSECPLLPNATRSGNQAFIPCDPPISLVYNAVSPWTTSNMDTLTLPTTGIIFKSACYAPEIDTLVVVERSRPAFIVKKGTERAIFFRLPQSLTFGPENTDKRMESLLCITWVPAWRQFVVCTNGGVNYFSPDGINWQAQTNPYPYEKNGAGTAICWSPEQNTLVVLTRDYNQVFVHRNDWKVVEVQNAHPSTVWTSVCWASTLGLFVAVAGTVPGGGTFNKVMISEDGLTWTFPNISAGMSSNWNSVCWAKDLGVLLAISDSNTVLLSSDGVNWELVAMGLPLHNWQTVCWASEPGVFVAVGHSVRTSSRDGRVWDSVQPMMGTWNNVIWIPQWRQFYAIARGFLAQSEILQSR